MIWTVAAIWITAQGSGLPMTPFTYLGPAARLEPLVASLAEACNLKLSVNPTIANEVAMLRVENRPVSESLERLAKALSAKWEPNETGFRLEPDKGAQDRDRFDEQSVRSSKLDAYFADWKKSAADLKPMTETSAPLFVKEALRTLEAINRAGAGDQAGFQRAYGSLSLLIKKGPVSRALTRVMAAINPIPFTSQPLNSGKIFATTPNRLQNPISVANLQGILSKFDQEIAILGRAFDTKFNGTAAELSPIFHVLPRSNSRTAAKVILRVLMGPDGVPTFIHFRIVDRSGYVLGSVFDYPGPAKIKLESASGEPWENEEYLPSADVAQMLQNAKRRASGITDSTWPAEPNSEWLVSDLNEPLAYFPGDAIRAIGQASKKPIAAAISDRSAQIITLLQNQNKPRISNLIANLKEFGLQKTVEGDWITFKPVLANSEMQDSINRFALAKFLRGAIGNGMPTLTHAVNFSVEIQNSERSAWIATWLSAIGMPGPWYSWDWDLLNVARGILRGQPVVPGNIKPVALDQLPPASKATLQRLLFFDQRFTSGVTQSWSSARPSSLEVIEIEATESFPDGLSPRDYVRLEAGSQLAVAMRSPEAPFGDAVTLEDLGEVLANEQAENQVSETTKLCQFRAVNRMQLTTFLNLGSAEISTAAVAYSYDPGSSWGLFQMLPKSIADRIDAARRSALEKRGVADPNPPTDPQLPPSPPHK